MDLSIGGFLSILLVMLIFIVPILWMTSAQFRFRVKIALYGVCFIASTTIGALISLPCGRTPKNHFRMFRIFEYSTFWMGTKFELRNMHYTESDKPFIIIANHQSVLDVLSMSHVWPKNCVVLLKSSLRFVPGFNLCTFLSNSIYIDRFNKAEAHKSLAKVADAIIKENRKVWIFPEGTRSSNGSMLPFKKGAFVIALQAKIPIVPLVFSSYKNFYDMSEFKFDYGGRVIIEALPPVDTSKFENIDELIAKCRQIMEDTYKRINEEIVLSISSNQSAETSNDDVNIDNN
uniref:1-acyl-sn-glycerol-3-phosphate acyltransferase n=2 Tax=Parascaris univalens TaxID=6257 RepID=A0A915BX19_PARUN